MQEGGDTHQVTIQPSEREGANNFPISLTDSELHLPQQGDRCAINVCLAGWGWLESGMKPKEVSDLREGKEGMLEA